MNKKIISFFGCYNKVANHQDNSGLYNAAFPQLPAWRPGYPVRPETNRNLSFCVKQSRFPYSFVLRGTLSLSIVKTKLLL